MFKKLLVFLGLGSLLLVGGCIALLVWGQRAGAQLQTKFFEAVVSGDAQQVLQLCDPDLKKELDAPVLQAWMNEIQAKLGKYQGMSASDFNTSFNYTDAGKEVESKGKVNFEHGEATSRLKFLNDRLIAFEIKSEKLADWFVKGPADTKPYRDRGEEFIRKFFAKDLPGTTAMMSEELRKNATDDKMKEIFTEVVDTAGPLKTVKFREEKFTTDDEQTLTVQYDVDGENAKLNMSVDFRFMGLKGHMNGFNYKSRDE